MMEKDRELMRQLDGKRLEVRTEDGACVAGYFIDEARWQILQDHIEEEREQMKVDPRYGAKLRERIRRRAVARGGEEWLPSKRAAVSSG